MKNKNEKEDDESGSDWDSLSEPKLAPKSFKNDSSENETDTNERQKIKERNEVINSRNLEEIPPYDFKSEIKTPIRSREKDNKPGKSTKGKTYETLSNVYDKIPKTPIKVTIENEISSQSEYEAANNNIESVRAKNKQNTLREIILANRKDLQKQKHQDTRRQSRKKYKKSIDKFPITYGIYNEGYDTEEYMNPNYGGILDYAKTEMVTETDNKKDEIKEMFDKTTNQSDKHMSEIWENDATLHILKPSSLNRIIPYFENGFSSAALPFSCFFLFFHYLIRFILLSIIKPLFWDTIALCSAYFISPIFRSVLQPVLQIMQSTTFILSEICINVLKPLVTLFQACRLVEINYNVKGNKQEHIV